MANELHIELLNRGVAEWNAWRQENPEVRPDLSEADLSGADLRDANLNGADLSGADLSGTNLSDANVSGTRFGTDIPPNRQPFLFSESEKLDLMSRGAIFEKNEELPAWLTDTSLKSTIGSAQRTYLDSTDSVTEDLCQSIRLPAEQKRVKREQGEERKKRIESQVERAPSVPCTVPYKASFSRTVLSSAPVSTTNTHCYVYAEMDDRVIVDWLTTLEVIVSGDRLEWQSSATAQSGKISVDSTKRIVVQVIAKSNFVVEKVRYRRTLIYRIFQFIFGLITNSLRHRADRVELAPPKSGRQSKLYFDLRATDLGEGEVWVVVRQGQVSLLQLSLKPLIVSNRAEARLPTPAQLASTQFGRTTFAPSLLSSTAAPAEQEPTVTKIRTEGSITEFPTQPESLHQLRIIEQRNGNLISYRYELDSPALKIFQDFQSQPITSERLDYVEHLYQEIESRWGSSADDVEAFTAELRAFGGKLFDELFPEALRSILWQRHNQIQSIMVISTEPFIPWELVHLKQPGQSHLPEETKFLGQMGLVRWLYGSSPPQTMQIRPTRAKYVIPQYPDSRYRLPQAEQELQFLEDTFQAIAIDPQPTPVRNALETGNFDLLHFAGHGLAEQGNIANAKLMLQGRVENGKYVQSYLNATTVEQYCKLSSSNRPMIVLNACEAGRKGYTLTGVGGFAQAFLKGGAGVFVGTLWSVGDRPARVFTETFYKGLMAGLPLAEATVRARETSRQSGDATWLAYVVYGHPHLKVEHESL